MSQDASTQTKDKEHDHSDKKGPLDKLLKKEKTVKDKTIKIKESEKINLIEEAAKYKDQYIRVYAEFENFRKRMERDKLEFFKYANEGIITEFLEILDNLERSVEAAKAKHEENSAFLKGVEMVMANIYDMLKKHNVEQIEAKGKMFDPHSHEVLMQEESDEHEEGMVLEEFQKGFRLGEKIIRTVKVKVAKKKEVKDNLKIEKQNTEDGEQRAESKKSEI